MPKGDFLGAFEEIVLLALVQLGDDAYGMTIRREIEDRSGRTVSIGAVYSTLDRLEFKGQGVSAIASRPTRTGVPHDVFPTTPRSECATSCAQSEGSAWLRAVSGTDRCRRLRVSEQDRRARSPLLKDLFR